MACRCVLLGAPPTETVGRPSWTSGSPMSGGRGTPSVGSAACRWVGRRTTKATGPSVRTPRPGYTLRTYLFICSNAQFSLLLIVFVFSSQSQSHDGQECNEFMAYAMAHKGKATAPDTVYNPEDGPEAYSNTSVHSKLTDYASAARERHGEDFDPATQPLDTDLVMRLGGGKQHGRYWMASNMVDSTSVPNLVQIRAQSTSSSVPIRPRQASTLQQMAALQVSSISFAVHYFYTCTLHLHCLNVGD